ncbi:MAG: VWA domain-containing protein, partial [Candidatus Levybacteria bacterium]|nr:VWA domain-containing protein [Candidatus Levybacteria bacterium]
MSSLTKKPFLILGLFILGLIVLPVTIFLFQQQQVTRSQADKTVILSYEPTSTSTAPLQIPAGSTFTLDVYVDPGPSAVSYIKAEMLYDATRFELAGGFIPNQAVFSQVVEGPAPTAGKVIVTLSIGSDPTKAITSKTKVGTLTLRTLNSVPANGTSLVSFGSSSQVLAVSSNTSFNENVIASTIPATVKFNQPALTCETSPADVMLVIDKSGSMNDPAGSSGSKISNAKTAANSFIDILAKEPRNTTGLTTFASTGTLNSPLTNAFAIVKDQVTAITTASGTCIECGILKANADLSTKKRPGIKNVVVLLTDGLATHVEGNSQTVSEAIAVEKALAAATNGHNTNGTIYFTIGLGNDVNSAFLTQLAEDTGGQYY